MRAHGLALCSYSKLLTDAGYSEWYDTAYIAQVQLSLTGGSKNWAYVSCLMRHQALLLLACCLDVVAMII